MSKKAAESAKKKEELTKTEEILKESEPVTPIIVDAGSEESSERDDIQEDHWKNKQYWALPENVR